MEIERKFLPLMDQLPFRPEDFPCRRIEQGYLCTDPVVRIRRDNDEYFLTYKSKGLLSREEYNLPLTPEGYAHLLTKADGRIITKKRYVIPLENNLKLELDIFEGDLAPLIIAEIEFPDEETARAYQPPKWLGEDVTYSPLYHNSVLSSPDTDISSLHTTQHSD
ncbi:MAG TPA: CYTH domain-containing protein [Candidatus Mediterraneibacter surreyensis]|nr:CYTH domain-containing protein [Candidatus Mediterraneibacter surreyensis]